MTRKSQKAYLDDILSDLADETTPPPEPEIVAPETQKPHIGTSVFRADNAISRLASGTTKQVVQHLIDPAKCRIWQGNARRYDLLDYERCKDLIASIIAEGGQKIPAIVRRLKDDPNYEYEVIVGSRRHWSITWLRAHDYPHLNFLIQTEAITDEAAFRYADIENREREDVSAYERAANYLTALDTYYGGQANRMADRLGISKSWLSKMLQLAKLPHEVVSAFDRLDEIMLKKWYPLIDKLRSPDTNGLAISEALRIKSEQEDRVASGMRPIPGAEVTARIISALDSKSSHDDNLPVAQLRGQPFVSVTSAGPKNVTMKINKIDGFKKEELLNALSEVVDQLFDE